MLLSAIAAVLVCQLLGETVVRALALPIPGPVAGLLLLLALLMLRDRRSRAASRDEEKRPAETVFDPAPGAPLGRLADGLLGTLGLLFVPAGVGVVDHLGLFATHGIALAAALALSTLATLLATVGVFLLFARLRSHAK